jgi:peptidoglycan hydrolase-like protein with peptidoglycan-binding domain
LWVALVGVQEDGVLLAKDLGETVLVPRTELAKRFLNQAVVLWHDPTPTASNMRLGEKTAGVQRLQEQLREVGLWSGDPTGVYDEATVDAVKRLQVRAGLKTDGITGRQTRMVLCSWTSASETPSLRNPDVRPAPPETRIPTAHDTVPTKNVLEKPTESAQVPVGAEEPPPEEPEQAAVAEAPDEPDQSPTPDEPTPDEPAPDEVASEEMVIEEDRIVSEDLDPVVPENDPGTADEQIGPDERAESARWQTGTKFPLKQSSRLVDWDRSS